MSDPNDKPTLPEQPKMVSLPAITDRALLEDLGRIVRNMADNLGTVGQNVAVLMEDRPVLHSRLAGVEGRMARLESPTSPPPPPITSTRVKALIDAHPSQMDLELQAAQAAQIVKDAERDRHIAETRSLVEQSATKEDVAQLAEQAATKKDVKDLADSTATKAEVKAIADGQTQDIVSSTISGVEALAARNKTVRNLLVALAGVLFLAMNAATMYLMRPAPQPQPIQMQVTK